MLLILRMLLSQMLHKPLLPSKLQEGFLT